MTDPVAPPPPGQLNLKVIAVSNTCRAFFALAAGAFAAIGVVVVFVLIDVAAALREPVACNDDRGEQPVAAAEPETEDELVEELVDEPAEQTPAPEADIPALLRPYAP